MTCSFCAAEIDEAAAACAGCSLGGGCRSVCCPGCGYKNPEEPRIFARLRGWLAERAEARARTSTVAAMRPGDRGTVTALDTGDAAQARKLVALGVVPGCEVELERRAPAFVLRLGRTSLAIDEALARSVVVRAQ
jgi:ferrous iron transport protein A